MAAMLTNIRTGIIANKTVKAMSVELGITEVYIYTLMRRRLGVEKVLLLPSERQLIVDTRARTLAAHKT